MTTDPADVRWLIDLDEDAFARAIEQRSFEDLRDTALALTDLIDSDAIGVDDLATVVRRARAILDACDLRLRRVENELDHDGTTVEEASAEVEEPF